MPIYEYRCNQCEREFEKYVQSAQAGHATAVDAPGTYFSNSPSHCLQRYS